ncbi:TPA: hypothetical protein R4Z70_002979 [Klebsiella variicola subsp. variicola]|uniref:hypothetical protein n=1 Tax=Klebsiella pneumoniae complex TaxID=3390273 RepID=UPI00044D472F|nr:MULTISPECIES: hypothetical protein [Klebsiella]EKZ5465001.1 hypothetical protein [Klebsiella quasipneumoniae]MDU1516734.1 hypothetical protein [Klebsiella michiganensis]HED1922221.1 hypothetical protein [Klebsiella variicola subsp. variicola]EIY5382294.1 hypothetical protein [Klebsiella variicola]EKZ5476164.1 hypothetical protein [Klebsiella quasipneumoniae]
MSIDKKITALAENIDEKRAYFEGCYAVLAEKQTTLKNLLATRESLKEEAHHQSDEWERNLLASGGVETEASDTTTFLSGMAMQKLERINPLIEKAQAEVITARFDAGQAALEYINQHKELRALVIEPECRALLGSLRPLLEIAWGLHCMTQGMDYEFDNMLKDVLNDVKKSDNSHPAEQHLQSASGDAETPLSLFPGPVPSVMKEVIRRSPSAAQMAMARTSPQKMQALADGREPCKGLSQGGA